MCYERLCSNRFACSNCFRNGIISNKVAISARIQGAKESRIRVNGIKIDYRT